MYIIFKNKKVKIRICKSFKDRLLGMMFLKKKIDYGLCFPKCSSIHTFFMFQKIDIVMTDKENRILYIKKSLSPWQIIKPIKNVYYTYEFSEGVVDNIELNQYLKIKKS